MLYRSPEGGKCLQILKRFQESISAFEIFHGQRHLDKCRRVLVLDSSFNPPHMGHYTLVERAVKYYGSTDLQVILLLSINNADKEIKPASLDKRMDMMCIMADLLSKNSLPVSVGITKYAKFFEKSTAISKELGHSPKISYLVGFDTIVRVFDSKYYAPLSVADALRDFMSETEFFCLTRDGETAVQQQLQYPGDIAKGVYEPNIPKSWHSKVVVEKGNEFFSHVSSSSLRKTLYDPNKDVSASVPPEIYHYIKNQFPYDIFKH
ncbi:nicotinamide-nucleotide adenylyltransferase [Lachancea thermotolerans CBS 6340]|uniref:KLTH0F01012p n=1 Tax=Lachancea thermotolerans (strain ATCC 56472 / CBS 6340 / NRRL Y-8284) TaxID=559295 RepID=C5DK15_LACTC|nr:KLTH0F01012p [Lachancea thermotolerans CBS 6340]CAR23816.1 KLTH0F01012p [Lachancea thermotolerans CBS 6340]